MIRAQSSMVRSTVRPIPVPESNICFQDVRPDRYAVKNMETGEYHYFQVSRGRSGKWAGWTFLTEITGNSERSVHWRSDEFSGVLSVIHSNPTECLLQYGKRTGICGICKKVLTDPVSVEVGAGPDCCEKYGIPRPGKSKGAKKTPAKKPARSRTVKKGGK